MVDDNADALVAYAEAFTREKNVTEVTMNGVDRYGFDLSVVTERGPRHARIVFVNEVGVPDAVRKALVALVKRACNELS
jgi:putative heme iron utilization protein